MHRSRRFDVHRQQLRSRRRDRPCTTGVCRFSGLLKVAAASRASPITDRQSGRLERDLELHAWCRSAQWLRGCPAPAGSRPLAAQRCRPQSRTGSRAASAPARRASTSSRRFPRRAACPLWILRPPGSVAPSKHAGTRSPTFRFVAPVTICTGVSAPTSTWQTTSLSASGCGSICSTLRHHTSGQSPRLRFRILPPWSRSSSSPRKNRASASQRGRNSSSHFIERFIGNSLSFLRVSFRIVSKTARRCRKTDAGRRC